MARKITVGHTKTTAAKETIYTVPLKNTGLWQLLFISSTVGTETPQVYWYDSSTNQEYLIIAGKNLGAGDYILFNQAEVVLQENDEIRIAQAGTNSVTYLATIELLANLTTQFHGA